MNSRFTRLSAAAERLGSPCAAGGRDRGGRGKGADATAARIAGAAAVRGGMKRAIPEDRPFHISRSRRRAGARNGCTAEARAVAIKAVWKRELSISTAVLRRVRLTRGPVILTLRRQRGMRDLPAASGAAAGKNPWIPRFARRSTKWKALTRLFLGKPIISAGEFRHSYGILLPFFPNGGHHGERSKPAEVRADHAVGQCSDRVVSRSPGRNWSLRQQPDRSGPDRNLRPLQIGGRPRNDRDGAAAAEPRRHDVALADRCRDGSSRCGDPSCTEACMATPRQSQPLCRQF